MLLKGQGTPTDEEEAFHWCSAAAEQELAEAQLQLGDLYDAGHGVEPDIALAHTWYEKAAGHGNADAAAELQSSNGVRKTGVVDV
jgi:TPR repeat protein